jgi:hypothetical protein
MRGLQLIGLLLWRGGVLLIVVTAVVLGLRALLAVWSPPVLVEVGLLLVLGGIVLVMISLILERVQDVRAERSNGGWSG